MSIFSTRPALRWGVPALAIVVVGGGGAALTTMSAAGAEKLPSRTAEQLLVDVQNARVDGLSGTLVENADLGLPSLPISGGGSGSSELSSLISGSHTMKVWTSGSQQVRLSLLGTLGESDVIRNGTDLWTWSSADHAATHVKLPAAKGAHGDQHSSATPKSGTARSGTAMTPQQLAQQFLGAVNPSTKVTTNGTASVAGRSAYELVLTPRAKGSLIGSVHIAIDGKTHVPLRVQVFSTKIAKPAFEVGFTSVSFGKPDAAQFTFNPPPGTKVTQQKLPSMGALMSGMPGAHLDATSPNSPGTAVKSAKATKSAKSDTKKRTGDAQPQIVGSGWNSVVRATVPKEMLAAFGSSGTKSSKHDGTPSAGAFLNSLPKVHGSWGSGRLLSGTMFSVLLTDSGTAYAGAVTPEVLYAAAGK